MTLPLQATLESRASPLGRSNQSLLPLAMVAAVLALRVVAAAALPLTEDEAYYRLWAQHPAFGYLDHPPMIAWWVRAGTALFGDNALGVRILPVMSSALTSALVFDLGRRLAGSSRVGLRAALWYNATITIGLGGLLAVPDAPASLFWAATLCALSRVREEPRWWIAAGLSAGLGILSKYSALFLGPGILVWLMVSPERRRWLKGPWPWSAALLAAAIAAPNLVWNAQHHWLTVDRQFGRMAPPGFAPWRLPEFLFLQTLLFGPALVVFAVKGWTARLRVPSDAIALIGATTAPFLGYLLIHSLHSQVQQHWPVPLFAGAAVMASLGAEAWPEARWLRTVVLTGLAAPLVVLAFVLAPQALVRRDPALSIEDWPDFSARVAALQSRVGAGWVGAVSYGLPAQLALQPVRPAPVLQLDERARYADWLADPAIDQDRPGLVVDLDRRMDRALMLRCFDRVEDLGVLHRGRPGAAPAVYRVFRVARPRFDLQRVGCPSRKDPADQS